MEAVAGPDEAVRVLGAAVLERRCREVENFGDRTRRLEGFLHRSLRRSADGIGLAANQVGVDARAFVWDLSLVGTGGVGAVFNPQVVDRSGAVTAVEGCLSIPGLYWPVTRAGKVTVTGQDADGRGVVVELDGLAARLFQHEIDHLDGVLLVDRVGDDERRAIGDELVRLGWSQVGRHWRRRPPEG